MGKGFKRKRVWYLSVYLFLIFFHSSKAQNCIEGLKLQLHNKTLLFSEERADSVDNLLALSLINCSEIPYFIVIDTTNFQIHDVFDQFGIKKEKEKMYGSPITMFRPWIKIYDSLNSPVSTFFSLFQPDLESEWYKKRSKLTEKNYQEESYADEKYRYLETQDPRMPYAYYMIKKHGYVVHPGDTLSFNIPVSLPSNDDMTGTTNEGFYLVGSNYKTVVEIDYSNDYINRIITQKDKDSLNSKNIRVFKGVLRSNDVKAIKN